MILWLIAAIACYVLGDLHGQGKFKWKSLGALAGKARGVVFGLRPASAAIVELSHNSAAPEVSPTPPKNPIRAGKAIANVLGFFGGLLAWCARNPIVAIGLVLILAYFVIRPFEFGKSRGELRLEREFAEMTATVREHEAHLAEISRDLAVNTERDRTRRTQVITQAQQEIEDATAQVDPDAQYSAYVRGYLCLLDAGACANSSDPAPAGTGPVRSPNADAA